MTNGGFRPVAGLLLVALVLIVGVTLIVLIQAQDSSSPTTVRVDLTIRQDPTTGLFAFSPASIHVPAGAMVQVVVTNFDLAHHSVAPVFCNVTGTTGGMMEEMGGGMGSMMGQNLRGLSENSVSHTFTMESGGYDVNVPIPPAAASGSPSVTEFSFQSHGLSEASWSCESTSGTGPMPMMGSFESS